MAGMHSNEETNTLKAIFWRSVWESLLSFTDTALASNTWVDGPEVGRRQNRQYIRSATWFPWCNMLAKPEQK